MAAVHAVVGPRCGALRPLALMPGHQLVDGLLPGGELRSLLEAFLTGDPEGGRPRGEDVPDPVGLRPVLHDEHFSTPRGTDIERRPVHITRRSPHVGDNRVLALPDLPRAVQVGDLGDQIRRHVNVVDLRQMSSDSPARSSPGVEGDDPLVEPFEPVGALGDDRRFETAFAVTRNVHIQGADLGLDRTSYTTSGADSP